MRLTKLPRYPGCYGSMRMMGIKQTVIRIRCYTSLISSRSLQLLYHLRKLSATLRRMKAVYACYMSFLAHKLYEFPTFRTAFQISVFAQMFFRHKVTCFACHTCIRLHNDTTIVFSLSHFTSLLFSCSPVSIPCSSFFCTYYFVSYIRIVVVFMKYTSALLSRVNSVYPAQ
jgi:hypothetical protein